MLEEKKTPWKSIYISIGMQFMIGIQISLYFMSMWPYLSTLEPNVSVEMLGWIVAACSLGCSLANPLFGLWNQKTLSVTKPVALGMILAAIGQTVYALLPSFSSNRLWIMVASRFVTGCGAGCLAVLRAYLSMASLPGDRLKAISYGTAGYVLGLSLGPAVQACFTPFGEEGILVGSIRLNMYTLPGYFMCFLCIVTVFVMKFFFSEEYVGLAEKSGDSDESSKIPKFDVIPAMICIYLWMVINMIATNIEVISTPMTVAMYNWNDSQAVTYNAILQALSCLVSVTFNVIIGKTRIGKIEKRIQILFGLTFFLLFHILNYPWPFYSGPLEYIPDGNTTAQIGGCMSNYKWCMDTVRIPIYVYMFCYVVFYGLAFPFVTSPAGTLFSEVLGPRRQGGMQGLHSLGGSLAQFVSPIVATTLFERSGYKYIMITQLGTVSLATILMLGYYRRLIPLQLTQETKSTNKVRDIVSP